MSTVSDNFVRANGSLGANWNTTSTIPPQTSQLLNDACAPSSVAQTGFPVALAAWAGAGTFSANQFSKAQISTIAPSQSVVSITAAVFAAGNVTYTYALTSGAALQAPQEIIVSGMQNAGNNGALLISSLAAGTFTAPNATGVNEAGSAGTGLSPTDSLAGPAVRMTPGALTGYFLFVGNNSGYVAFNNGTVDNRQYVVELWKLVSGAQSELIQILTSATIPDVVGDIYYLFALQNKIVAYKNNFVCNLGQGIIVDSSILSGVPGLEVSSAQGAGHTMPLGANVGVSGFSMTNFVGSDLPSTPVNWTAKATEVFTVAGNAPTPPYITIPGFGAIAQFQGLGGSHSGETGNGGGFLHTGRTWAPNQASQIVVSNVAGNTSIFLAARYSSSVQTGYFAGFIFTNGLGAGTFEINAFTNGTTTQQVTVAGTVNFADVLHLEVIGTTINLKQNGVTVLTMTDTSISQGSPGAIGFGNAWFLYWEGEEYFQQPGDNMLLTGVG